MKISAIRNNQSFKAIYKFNVDYNNEEQVDKVAILHTAIQEGMLTPLSKNTSLVYEHPYAPISIQDFTNYYKSKNCGVEWARNHVKAAGIELPEYLYTKSATQYLLTDDDAKDYKNIILKNPMNFIKSVLAANRITRKVGDNSDTAFLRSIAKVNEYGYELFNKFLKGREVIEADIDSLVQIDNTQEIQNGEDEEIDATIEIVKPAEKKAEKNSEESVVAFNEEY